MATKLIMLRFMTPSTPRQTHFDDGGFNFLQNTLNLDLSRSFKSIALGLNLGLGAEYRYERYGIYAGEKASYKKLFYRRSVLSKCK
ncbi:MAG: hypothetical protein IPP81_11240 [Chitinophagaceae bacterium]|nr:hypothetical protein [Chitinophagaceae bacterium]